MRHFSLIMLTVLALSLVATAPIGATPTSTPTPAPDQWTADDVREFIASTNATNATVDDVRRVADWVRGTNVSAALPREDGEAVRTWLLDAAADRHAIALPNASDAKNTRLTVPEVDVEVSDPSATSTPTRTTAPTSTPTATPTASPQPTARSQSTPNATETERIDGNTVIVGSRYLPEEGVALVTLRSSTPQAITLSDAGRFAQGGKVPTTTVAVGSETTTIEISVTEVNGRVGVAITTKQTPLYSEIIESGSGDGLGILRAVSPLQAWFGGVAIAFVWMAIAGWSVMREEGGRPEVAT